MALTLGDGTQIAVAKTYGTSSAITAITNATEAVATLATGHGTVPGDFLEVTSGWERLSSRIVRAKVVATNDVTFESINTVSTTAYPAGAGAGSIRRITAWDTIIQAKDLGTSGGDRKGVDATPLSSLQDVEIPTSYAPLKMEVEVFDDILLAWYATILAYSQTTTAYAFRIITANGGRIAANAFVSLQEMPNIKRGAVNTQKIMLSTAAVVTRYAT